MKNKRKTFFLILLLIDILMFIILRFVISKFNTIPIDELLYHLNAPLVGSSNNFFMEGLNYCIPKIIAIYIFVCSMYLINENITCSFQFKSFKIKLDKIFPILLIIISILFFFCILYFTNSKFFILNYIKSFSEKSSFIEDNYVEPLNTKIIFSDSKRNLIYIFVESLESTDMSIQNGGYREESIIPELEKLAKNNINFSGTEKIGGAYPMDGTTWTIAGIISQTSGLPLKGLSNINNFGQGYSILRYALSLGDILNQYGYKNYFYMGSDMDFAGRGTYLESHNYNVFDFNSAINSNKISSDYNINWWGFEDKKLFEYSKEKLLQISSEKQPFSFSILTVDTHPFDGYLDETCDIDSTLTHYENVFKCNSKMINEFVNWIKRQDFYKNTTIIISGDHLNMVSDGIHDEMPQDFNRSIYNVFINSSVSTKCNKNRIFTTMDMFPTTIAAIGGKIQGNKLGLGTDLFSCFPTLSENQGVQNMSNEMKKYSTYYTNCLFNGQC